MWVRSNIVCCADTLSALPVSRWFIAIWWMPRNYYIIQITLIFCWSSSWSSKRSSNVKAIGIVLSWPFDGAGIRIILDANRVSLVGQMVGIVLTFSVIIETLNLSFCVREVLQATCWCWLSNISNNWFMYIYKICLTDPDETLVMTKF